MNWWCDVWSVAAAAAGEHSMKPSANCSPRSEFRWVRVTSRVTKRSTQAAMRTISRRVCLTPRSDLNHLHTVTFTVLWKNPKEIKAGITFRLRRLISYVLRHVYSDTTQLDVELSCVVEVYKATQLNSTASCRSADGASAVLNVVTQLK